MVFALASGPATAGAVRLVLPTTGLPGLRASAASVRSARADLTDGLSSRLAGQVRVVQLQTVTLAGHDVHVRSDAFVFSSPAAALRVLGAWRRAHHASAVTIGRRGGGGLRLARASRATVVTVVWREGAALGAIVLRATPKVVDPRARALAYATLADAGLQTGLPATAWERVLDEVRPDGTVSRATALQAFVLAYGPLPGVARPPGRAMTIADGTLAAQWTTSYRATLTHAQRSIVDRRLGLESPTTHTRAHTATLGDPYFTPSAKIQLIADTEARIEGIELQRTLGMTIVAGETTDPQATGKYGRTLASETSFNVNGVQGSGKPVTCRIRLTKAAIAEPPAYYREIIAHEVFHCFQDEIRGTDAWTSQPKWITEGTAEWVAETVEPAPEDTWPLKYIDSSTVPLFQRTYDAVGFWGHVEDSQPGLWSRLASVLTAKTNVAAYRAATDNDDSAFLGDWGSSVFRAGTKTSAARWSMTSPIETLGFVAHRPGQLVYLNPTTFGAGSAVDAPPYTTAQYFVQRPDDQPVDEQPVLHVGLTGHARLGFQEDYTSLGDAWFCTSTAPCTCPPDETGDVPSTQPLLMPASLGLSGDPDGGTYGDVTSYPLSTFCHPKSRPGPANHPGPANRGVDNGDPYLTTFGGGHFGLQIAGEFTLVRSKTGDLEIQGRQQPYSKVRHPEFAHSLAMNTAFAMRVGRATVEVAAVHTLAVYVDKRRVHPAEHQTIALAGGGSVQYGRIFTRVTWPDGTNAVVLLIGSEGVNLFVAPSAARVGHLTGLMGDDGGADANQYVGRNGRRYPNAVVEGVGLFGGTPHQQQVVYKQFGRSWRITQRASLFVYPKGRTTRSYDVKGFPNRMLNLKVLSAAQRAAAAKRCGDAHVTDPAVLAGCELDTATTGRKEFADSDGALETALVASAATATPAAGPPISTVPWTQLSTQADNATAVAPAMAVIGGSAVVAFRRATDQAVEAATFTPSASGVGAVSHDIALSGWAQTADPVLLESPSGGLQVIVPGHHSDTIGDPLNGTVAVARNPGGTFGPPARLSPDLDTGVTSALLASDATTALWAAGGALTIYDGSVKRDLTAASPDTSYAPALGRDESGRVWLAWYVVSLTPGVSGLYMVQLDPITGLPLKSAVHAPASDGPNNNVTTDLACSATCRLVYADVSTNPNTILSWAPGDAAPATEFNGVQPGVLQAPIRVQATYTSDGRLWIAWANVFDEQEYAQLGAVTTPVQIPKPPGAQSSGNTAVATIGARLVVATNWLSDNTTTVWATTLDPPNG